MIRFKCNFCGRVLRANEGSAGHKGKCPKCCKIIVVPTVEKTQISIEKPAIINASASEVKPKEDRKDTFEDLRENPYQSLLLNKRSDSAEIHKERWGFLIPTYDESSLFLMAISLILLVVFNGTMRSELYHFLLEELKDIRTYVFIPILIIGFCLCLYHPFTLRKKTEGEKYLMLIIAVIANGGTAILAGSHMLENTTGLLVIFPAWNMINGLLLLIMLRFKIIDQRCISDRDATGLQIVLGLIAVITIFVVCNYVYQMYWAITFSICIVYTTSFDKAIQSLFNPCPLTASAPAN